MCRAQKLFASALMSCGSPAQILFSRGELSPVVLVLMETRRVLWGGSPLGTLATFPWTLPTPDRNRDTGIPPRGCRDSEITLWGCRDPPNPGPEWCRNSRVPCRDTTTQPLRLLGRGMGTRPACWSPEWLAAVSTLRTPPRQAGSGSRVRLRLKRLL